MPLQSARSTLRMLIVLLAALTALRAAPASEDAAALMRQVETTQPGQQGEADRYTLEQLMRRLRVPGVSIAVVRDFEVHWAKGYGVADVETRRPVTPETLFQAASISKPVTALAVMRLAQEGRLSIDADVNTLLRSWRVPPAPDARPHPVTVRALLSHTSGADDGFGFPGYAPDAPRPSLLQILNGEPPSNVGKVLFTAGPYQRYKYSGGGTTIVQVLLSELSGQAFEPLMRATVLDPLGMTDSTFEQPLDADRSGRAARAHDERGRPKTPSWHVYPEQAAAGLWTTAGDLARVLIELQIAARGPHGRVLSQAAAREMLTPVGVGPFGVGVGLTRLGDGWYFEHGGSNWGYRARIIGHLRNGYGAVVMTNGDNGTTLAHELELRIAAAYGWDALQRPSRR
jgi:CubicO group peptidase (beta-lactamase class C family)